MRWARTDANGQTRSRWFTIVRGKANVIVGAIIAVVVIAAIVAVAVVRIAPASGARAVVHDGDGGVWELPLSEDSEITVTSSFGTNVVAVEGGSVFVRDADCDNHDCIRQGRINVPGAQIICLPHKLWIEVVVQGDGAGEMDINTVAGAAGGDVDVTTR